MSAPTTVDWLRTAVHRIAVGSGRRAAYLAAWVVHRARRVWRSATSWLGEGEGIGWALRLAVLVGAAAVLRKILTAVAVGLYERAASGGAPWLLWGAALGWVVSAYRAGADGWTPKRPANPGDRAASESAEEQPAERTDSEPTPPAAEQAPAGPPPVSPVALVAAVRDIGTPHAQLKPLAEHLGTTTDAVRAAAAGMGWTVKDVRMAGRSSTAGLRWDEVPPLPSPDPSWGVVGAGQAADDNDDDTGGRGFTTVPDEVNPVRTHVVWKRAS